MSMHGRKTYIRERMAAKFKVCKEAMGEFHWGLKARSHKVIATGEGYKATVVCKSAIWQSRTLIGSSREFLNVMIWMNDYGIYEERYPLRRRSSVHHQPW
ncbi:MAG: DUF1508 domain-containing protein [Anaerolineales bacterium]|nr:DUF1508 domain-containing protein [Anaerolineales bacterium]